MEITMSLLLMLGGVAVFMYGMKQMSQGIEQSAGAGVRRLFASISKNRVMDYGVGIAATAIVQSSSASSIMTVGLANAGIVTVKQGAGIILGAKVGTTLTAFIFAMSGLSHGGFSISAVFAVTAFVGVLITYTTSNDTLVKLSRFLTGFGMLFIGLEVMEFAIGGKDSVLSTELTKIFQFGFMQNPILLMLIAIVFTGFILQSSTAATGLFLAFLATGVVQSLDQAFFLVMGANIGTCSDGLMAAIGSNAKGKRIAVFHVLTSTMGAAAFSVILMLFRAPIIGLFESVFPDNPQWSLATYNLAYNAIYTLSLLALRDPLVGLVTRLVKDRQEKMEQVFFIDDRLLATPSVAIEQALKEVANMAALARENLDCAFASLVNEDMSQSKKIADREYRIDHITRALASFFIKISSTITSAGDEKLIGGLHHVINDIERLGDYAVLLIQETNDMKQRDAHFVEQTQAELREIYGQISEMFGISLEAFQQRETKNLKQISSIHKGIIKRIRDLRDVHVDRLTHQMYSVEVSKSLYNVLFSLQRVADHIVNMGFSIRSNTGSKVEAFQSMEKNAKK